MAETKILLESGTNELEILEFVMEMDNKNIQSFGINVAKVRNVIKVPSYDEVPKSHPCIRGIFQLRDMVIPLIDLPLYLIGRKSVENENTKVIITEFNKQNLGFLIDDVVTIHRISWKKVLPPTKIIAGIETACVTSMVPMKDKTLLMIDFEKIVSDIDPKLELASDDVNEDVSINATKDYKLLIIDDSQTFRNMVSELMEKAGFKVTMKNNGQEAFELLTETKELAKKENKDITEYFDLIVSDIEMPQMDGHALCKAIKNDKELKKLPVILFSSIIYEELRRKGEAVGADAQISKPDAQDLVKIAKEFLKIV
jgi:two-component system chemotaxis response regulator CheV